MQVGMIGLGRMGANLARRLMLAGHPCVVSDRDPAAVAALAGAARDPAVSDARAVRRARRETVKLRGARIGSAGG